MSPKITLVSVNSCEFPTPPLGIASIATYLVRKGVVDKKTVQILDLNLEKKILPKIKKFKPDIIGISSMTQFYPRAIKLAKKIKAQYKKLPVVIGGVHISTAPHSFSEAFDIGVIGEGEETFYELIRYFKKYGSFKNSKLRNIPGLVFKEEKNIIQASFRKLITPLDILPWPDWQLFSPYLSQYLKGRPLKKGEKPYKVGYIITSRGCPYRCAFCSTSVFWKKLRFHTPKYVVEQIEYLAKKFNIKRIVIQDDIFNFSKKRLKEIIIELDKRNLLGKVSFGASVRADYVDEEFCQIFKKMGGTSVFIGFESGSEKILKFLKNNTVVISDNKKAALLLNKHQLEIKGGIIFGSPGENLDDMKKSLQFMKWFSQLKYAARLSPYILTPFPGTKIWELALQKGLVSNDMENWGSLHLTPSEPFFLDKVDKASFRRIYKRAKDISHEITLSRYVRLKTGS